MIDGFPLVFQREFHGQGLPRQDGVPLAMAIAAVRKVSRGRRKAWPVRTLFWGLCWKSQLVNVGKLGTAYQMLGLAHKETCAVQEHDIDAGLDGPWSSCFGTIHTRCGRDNDEAREQRNDGMMTR